MSYTPYHSPGTWEDFPDETTPITAAALDYIENGVEATSVVADAALAAAGGSGAFTEYLLASPVTAGDTTFTLDRAPGPEIAVGQGYFVIEPWTPNCEIRRYGSAVGDVVTIDRALATTVSATFVAASKKILATPETMSQCFPGQTIVLSGTASNNGVFTVADYPADGSYDGTYITVNETLVNEGPISTAVRVYMGRDHAAGSTVFWATGPVQASWYGAKASASGADASNNRLGLQRMFDDSFYTSVWDLYLPGFFEGRYYIDAPLYIEKLTHLRGVHHKGSVIAATSSFPVWNDDVAMLITRRNGLPCRITNGGNDRYHISHMGLDGANTAHVLSPGFSQSSPVGTGYSASGTNTFAVHASKVTSHFLAYHAVTGGTGGNSVRVAHVNDGPSTTLSVSVSGNDITVHLGTASSGSVISTVSDVIAAVNASGPASALVVASPFVPAGTDGADGYIANVESAFAMVALTAGTAPFVSGDVGRSLYLGQREGARNIVAYVNAYTVTVDGDPFDASYAGRRWAISPVNGFLGAFNQTSRLVDYRIESCPGYGFCTTGAQECSVYNLMTVGNGVHVRIVASQFVRFYETNMEASMDAFVTFENIPGEIDSLCRSIHFIGTHTEGDVAPIDYFRSTCFNLDGIVMINNYSTCTALSTVFKNDAFSSGYIGFMSYMMSGPNGGVTFMNDVTNSIVLPMTNFRIGNSFVVGLYSIHDDVVCNGQGLVRPAWASTITPDARMNATHQIVATSTTAAAIANPLYPLFVGQQMIFDFRNATSTTMGAVNWGTLYLLAGALTNPGDGKHRSIAFQWDGYNWVEMWRSAADVGGVTTGGTGFSFNYEEGTDTQSITGFAVNTPAGATFTYSATHAYDTLSGRITTNGTGPVQYTSSAALKTEHWGRIYVYCAANPAPGDLTIVRGLNSGGRAFDIAIKTDGKIDLRDAGGTTRGTSTNSIGLNQWVRLEWHVLHDVSAGAIEVKLFNSPDSPTETETVTATGSFSTLAAADLIRFGIVTGGVNSYEMFIDNVVVFDPAYPGPA